MVRNPIQIQRVLVAFKVAILLIPVALIGWLLNRNFLLGGSVTYSYHPGAANGPIALSRPSELVASAGADGDLHWRLLGNQLHFSVLAPRSVVDARVRIRVRNIDQPGITLVAQGTATVGEIHRVVHSTFLNTLTWPSLSEGGLMLWQRNPTYSSIEAFLDAPPRNSRVAVVGVPADRFTEVPGYKPTPTPIRYPTTFRGRHTLLVYVGSEDLNITFVKRDLNRSNGSDALTVRVDDPGGEQRLAFVIPDDGTTSPTGRLGPEQPGTVRVPGIGPGIVRITLDSSEDVLLGRFVSSQQYLSFERSMFLAPESIDGEQQTTTASVVVRGETLTLQTAHAEGLQTVTVGDQRYELREVKRAVEAPIPNERTIVTIPKADALLETDGVLSLLPAQLVPRPWASALSPDSVPDPSSYEYVLARYSTSESYGIQTIDVLYPAKELLRTQKRYHFVLDAPNLRSRNATLEVDSILVTFHPSPIRWSSLIRTVWDSAETLWTAP